jgi:hypothetical protein
VRQARPGMLLLSNMTLSSDKGSGARGVRRQLRSAAQGRARRRAGLSSSRRRLRGSLRPIVVVPASHAQERAPAAGRLALRAAPRPAQEVGEDAEFKSDMAFFFTRRSCRGAAGRGGSARAAGAALARKEKFIHALPPSVEAGDGARTSPRARGASGGRGSLDKADGLRRQRSRSRWTGPTSRGLVVVSTAPRRRLSLKGRGGGPLKAGDIAEIPSRSDSGSGCARAAARLVLRSNAEAEA